MAPTDAQTCISCGMPLRSAEDHPLGDTTKPYCKYCAREDGALKSYDEALDGMSAFMQRTQGIAPEAARDLAKGMMAKMPAWRGK